MNERRDAMKANEFEALMDNVTRAIEDVLLGNVANPQEALRRCETEMARQLGVTGHAWSLLRDRGR